ncbi:hypothetical protein EVAR_39875_1 [Eumeta japonica]|uniref:HTH psq-type domain-containing protein n=1 Tax=Eumeta variegata TaxID=151549 RepID=A0A4C1WR26_EUMVA|nr:hypothetical protein EVAR_39875_1 [Eumeta japonica]
MVPFCDDEEKPWGLKFGLSPIAAITRNAMPKVRPRKTDKASWTMDQLEKAIKLIEEQNYSVRKAAKTMNIPFSSLQKRYTKPFKAAYRRECDFS